VHIDEVKREAAIGNRILAELGLASGVRSSLGHVSARVPADPDTFVVKGRGYRLDALSRLRPGDLVTCDLDGFLLDGPPGVIPCFEVKIHSCIYKARPDVQSVVHVHPKFATVLTVLKKRIVCMCLEGNRSVLNPLPVYPHQKMVTTDEEGTEIARLLGDGNIVLMFGHGATTVGKDVEEAVTTVLHLEHQAEMNYYAYAAAGKDHPYVPDELVKECFTSWGSLNQFGAQWELPHFVQAVEKAGRPKHNGAWEHWSAMVSQDL
jgi:ribulose-5-phosphate 4-epimerase/fuculose-1-phosphate aldolase